MRAGQILETEGYTNVVDQRCGYGGMRNSSGRIVEPGWTDTDLPIDEGAPKGCGYKELAKGAK